MIILITVIMFFLKDDMNALNLLPFTIKPRSCRQRSPHVKRQVQLEQITNNIPFVTSPRGFNTYC